MATITTPDGVNIYYEEVGEGESVIFVHEFAGDVRSWEPQVRYFSRRYRCIAFAAHSRHLFHRFVVGRRIPQDDWLLV